VTVVFGPQLWIPEPLSVHVKFTPTSVLFQPFAFATGERLPVIPGTTLSSRYDAVPVADWPLQLLLLFAVAVTVCVPLPVAAVKLNVHKD
jgi:hypothetical protein